MKKHDILAAGLTAAAIVLATPGYVRAEEGHEHHEKQESREHHEEHEQRVKLQDCPAAVQQTIKEQAAGGMIEKVVKGDEDEDEGGGTYFEAEVTKDNKKMEIKVATDGKLLKTGPADQDDDDDDKDEVK